MFFTAADIPGENKIGHLKHDQYTMIPVGGLTHYLGDAIALCGGGGYGDGREGKEAH